MKKMTFLLLSLFFGLTSTLAVTTENLYMIGNATTAEWNNGSALQMTKVEAGIYTWEGTLKGKDTGDNGKIRFKFLIDGKNWAPAITPRYDAGLVYQVLESGVETEVYEHPGGAGTYDVAFQVPSTAKYRIDINLNTMKMTCTEVEPVIPPYTFNLYLIGNATTAEWNNGSGIQMTTVSPDVFTWTGVLKSKDSTGDGKTRFKFLIDGKNWAPAITPRYDAGLVYQVLESGVETDVYKHPGGTGTFDVAFQVEETAEYTINIDLNTMKMTCTRNTPAPYTKNLYLIGNATTAGWDQGSAVQMTKISNDVFRWKGILKSKDEENARFKFLIDGKNWSPAITPKYDVEELGDFVLVSGIETDVYKHPSGAGTYDVAFQVTKTAEYTIDIDLNTMKMTCTEEPIITPPYTENLFLIGNATTADWSNGSAIQMSKVSNDVFTWTGILRGKDAVEAGKTRFKFLIDGKNWSPCVLANPITDKLEYFVLTSGLETDVYKWTGNPGYDNAFQVSETGIYTIHIDLNTMKMTCTQTERLDFSQLYLVGNATAAGWDAGKAVPMIKVKSGVFIWCGTLDTQNGNEFKLVNLKNFANSINPNNDYNFTVDTDYNLTFKAADKKFKVTTAGIYTIKADLNTMKLRILEGNHLDKIDLSQLYLLGNATTAGYNNSNPIEMTKESEGIFTWTGTLSTANGNEFKFQNVKGEWAKSVNPKDGNTGFVVNTDYDLNFRPYEGSPNDFKFTVTATGTYTIHVDLNTMKLRITTDPTGIDAAKAFPFEVKTTDGNIRVIAGEQTLIQSVNIFDLSGKKISGNKLSKGVYILKVKYNNREYTQKIMI